MRRSAAAIFLALLAWPLEAAVTKGASRAEQLKTSQAFNKTISATKIGRYYRKRLKSFLKHTDHRIAERCGLDPTVINGHVVFQDFISRHPLTPPQVRVILMNCLAEQAGPLPPELQNANELRRYDESARAFATRNQDVINRFPAVDDRGVVDWKALRTEALGLVTALLVPRPQ